MQTFSAALETAAFSFRGRWGGAVENRHRDFQRAARKRRLAGQHRVHDSSHAIHGSRRRDTVPPTCDLLRRRECWSYRDRRLPLIPLLDDLHKLKIGKLWHALVGKPDRIGHEVEVSHALIAGIFEGESYYPGKGGRLRSR
jgi:hypothetical protein